MSKFNQPIKDIVLAITYQCNSRCRFCNIWQKNQTHALQPEFYYKLPYNINNVNISGGEPFLREDLNKIVEIISKRCPKAKIVISTNGFCPERILLEMPKLLKIKPDIGAAVSLDGLKIVHEKLRGHKNGFDKVFETIQILRNIGVKNIKIAFTLSDDNWYALPKVYQLAKSLSLEFSLAVRHNSEHFFQNQDTRIKEPDKVIKALNWLVKQELKGFWPNKSWVRAYFAYGALYFVKTGNRILPDYTGLNSLFIDPFGHIFPSDVWNLSLGQIQEIHNWDKFLAYAQAKVIIEPQAPASWMICTARQAMKKHWLKVSWWIIKNKLSL